MVAPSIGNNPMVAPYSGAMLASVARSGTGKPSTPGPKNSTNLATTPLVLSAWVTVSTKSVVVTAAARRPLSRQPTTSGIRIDTGSPSITAPASNPPTPQPTTPRPLIIGV